MAAARVGRRLSSAAPLALAYLGLVVYASLYPFEDWRWPPGQPLPALAQLPWPAPWLPFDLWANALGYAPLAALVTIAVRRSGGRLPVALAVGLLGPVLLSYTMELAQQFLPHRHVSAKDWLMNGVGAAAGTALAWAWLASGGVQRWHRWRENWFGPRGGVALALLLLWPLALLMPTAVPLGLGDVFGGLRQLVLDLVDGVPWAAPVAELLAESPPTAGPPPTLVQILVVALGLLTPCALAASVVDGMLRRLGLAVGALVLALAALTLSTLLEFGPQHAMAWLTLPAAQGLALGTLGAMALAPWPARGAAAIGLVAGSVLVATVAHLPPDPYLAQSLLAWEQGRFVRFHGVTQWLGWLWPYLALGWLLARLVRGQN